MCNAHLYMPPCDERPAWAPVHRVAGHVRSSHHHRHAQQLQEARRLLLQLLLLLAVGRPPLRSCRGGCCCCCCWDGTSGLLLLLQQLGEAGTCGGQDVCWERLHVQQLAQGMLLPGRRQAAQGGGELGRGGR